MQQFSTFILLAYLMIGVGASTKMRPHDEYPKVAYVIRAVAWPFVAGATIVEHRQLVLDARQFLRKLAELKGKN